MNLQLLTDEAPLRGRLPSNAYSLAIRQGPARAKVAGAKEKDRKPIDPPPIIQLVIRDSTDPAQNYLQSPYYFMCCNLLDANLINPTPLAASTTLAGTLVSSLHRLKDIDNTGESSPMPCIARDGGFFVFGDVSVKIEGDFRLRFSLFEMVKNEVVFIKSIISEPFEVFTQKTFPGMSESTFLSRSFGDQGVRLRIRKEPRTLLKRTAAPNLRPEDYNRTYSQQPLANRDPLLPPQHKQNGDYGLSAPRIYPTGQDESAFTNEPAHKRQRTSMDMTAYSQPQPQPLRDPLPHPQHKPSGDYGPSTPRGYASPQDEPMFSNEPSFKRQRTSTDLTNRGGYEMPNRGPYDLQNRVAQDPMNRVAQDPMNRVAQDPMNRVAQDPMSRVAQDPMSRLAHDRAPRDLPTRPAQDPAHRANYDLVSRGNYDAANHDAANRTPYDLGNNNLTARASFDLTSRGNFDQEQRYGERSYEDPRATYTAYTTRNLPLPGHGHVSNFNPPGYLGGFGLGAREGGSRAGEGKGYGP